MAEETTKRILMVDDEPEWLGAHIEILREEGHDVTFASNIDGAISILRDRPKDFDLLILDMLMPPSQQFLSEHPYEEVDVTKSGLWLYRQLREKLSLQGLDIIFFSVITDEEIRDEILRIQQPHKSKVDFLYKPVLPSDLVEKVRQVLND